jgi:hypothetical protein
MLIPKYRSLSWCPELFRTLTAFVTPETLGFVFAAIGGSFVMDISRWHRDTSLLVLSLSIDNALRSKDESSSDISKKHGGRRLRPNNRMIVELSQHEPRERIQAVNPVRIS